MKPLRTLALLAGLALSAAPLAAAEIGPVKIIRMSGEVFAAAQQTSDVFLMIAAARLRKSAGLVATTRAPDGQSSGENAGDFLSWSAMLDIAAPLAEGDDILLGLIEDLRAESTKGVAGGPVYSIVKIRAGGADTYASVPFEGGKYAEVYIEGKGNSDLNLYIYDDQNRLVCSDTDISDIAYCGWRPASEGAFKLTIKNKGKSSNQYSLITN